MSPTTYAPRMFVDTPEAKEQAILALEAAMDRLMSRGRVVIVNSSEAPWNDPPARSTKVLKVIEIEDMPDEREVRM